MDKERVNTCNKCACWSKLSHAAQNAGECRFAAPRPFDGREHQILTWPITYPSEWCSKFIPRDEMRQSDTMPKWRRGTSYQCKFQWMGKWHSRGGRYGRCIRHQGHDQGHTDMYGHGPTQNEYAAAKAAGVADC